jgi:hypothetical protein
MPTIPDLQKAEAGGVPEVRSWRPAWHYTDTSSQTNKQTKSTPVFWEGSVSHFQGTETTAVVQLQHPAQPAGLCLRQEVEKEP